MLSGKLVSQGEYRAVLRRGQAHWRCRVPVSTSRGWWPGPWNLLHGPAPHTQYSCTSVTCAAQPRSAPPERLTRQSRALGECLQLGPLDARVAADLVPVLGEAAIHAGDQVLLSHHAREVLDAPGDQLRVLHHVGGLGDE